MTLTQRIAVGAAAAWFSRGVTIVLAIALLPVLFRHLRLEELGVWLLLGQTGAAFGVLDLGFGATLTRRIAFAKGKSGADPDVGLTRETVSEVGNLVATGSRIYWLLALAAFVISCSAGFIYFQRLQLESVSMPSLWASWTALCFSQAFALRAGIWSCVLLGVGYVGWDSVLGSLTNVVTLLAQIVVVLLGGGLMALATVAAAGAITQRSLILGVARRIRPELFAFRGQWSPETFFSMTSPALRAWLTALGAAMILYTDQILIASSKGPGEIPAYRAAFVLIHNMTVVATTLGVASAVFISHLWKTGDLRQIHRIVERNARFGWLLMLTAAAYLLTTGEALFDVWLGPGNFVGYPVVIAFLITETFETQSYIIATASRATEDEAFAVSAIAAGILKLLLSSLFVLRFGLLGIALGSTVALLLTNHWYMVYRGLGRLRLSWRQYARSVWLPSLMAFAVILAILRGTLQFVSASSAGVQFVCVTTVAAILFALSVWNLVLEPSHRARLGRALRLAASGL